ncbi:MAG: TrpB-like pyridoxal phosphate-dependent enzyme [Methylotetracoccus sp.]
MDNRIFQLGTEDLPAEWFNILATIPYQLPFPVDPGTGKAMAYEKLAQKYSSECTKIELQIGSYGQAVTIPIPEPVLREYRMFRPTPIYRALGLEDALGYKGRIYFKREDLSPSGSHKPNTALAQAYYASQDGLAELVTDTGAGQWGAALAYSCRRYGIRCSVFMTRKSYLDKPYRAVLMNLSGGEVFPSPSDKTHIGKELLAQELNHTGSLGIGMAEAMEFVMGRRSSRLALGCMSYYAALHQTVIGLEVKKQLEFMGQNPDLMIACVGGGTNFMGFVAPFLSERIQGKNDIEFVAVESSNIPALTQGRYEYDFQDFSGLTPKVKMYTLGHEFIPPPIHSGGLRYHGKAPVLSLLFHHGHVRATAIDQEEAFAAGRFFFEHEGVLPAPETNHAIAQTIREVARAKEEGVNRTILFCFSGTGYLDLQNYKDMMVNRE